MMTLRHDDPDGERKGMNRYAAAFLFFARHSHTHTVRRSLQLSSRGADAHTQESFAPCVHVSGRRPSSAPSPDSLTAGASEEGERERGFPDKRTTCYLFFATSASFSSAHLVPIIIICFMIFMFLFPSLGEHISPSPPEEHIFRFLALHPNLIQTLFLIEHAMQCCNRRPQPKRRLK